MSSSHSSEGAAPPAFVPSRKMMENLFFLVDVADAQATVASDKRMILETLLPQILGTPEAECAAKVNSLARGCLVGSGACMSEPLLVRAALGETAPLLALSKAELEARILGSCAPPRMRMGRP